MYRGRPKLSALEFQLATDNLPEAPEPSTRSIKPVQTGFDESSKQAQRQEYKQAAGGEFDQDDDLDVMAELSKVASKPRGGQGDQDEDDDGGYLRVTRKTRTDTGLLRALHDELKLRVKGTGYDATLDDDLGIDSPDLLLLQLELEDDFEITLEDDDFTRCRKVQDIIDLVGQQLATH